MKQNAAQISALTAFLMPSPEIGTRKSSLVEEAVAEISMAKSNPVASPSRRSANHPEATQQNGRTKIKATGPINALPKAESPDKTNSRAKTDNTDFQFTVYLN